MRTDIIEYLQKEVYHRCKQPTNKFGMGCYYHIEAVVKNAEIMEFAKELHSEMEKVVLMDKLPENWTYPLIQPKLIEKYLQMKNFVDDTLYR